MKKSQMIMVMFVLLLISRTFFASAVVSGSEIPIIDVHSQVDQNTDIETVIPLMDKAGVAKTILSTRFERSSQDILSYARKHPDRIIPAFKTKTRAFMKGSPQYKNAIETENQYQGFGAMAEVILYHAQKGNKAGQASVLPDSEQAQALLAVARSRHWPFIFHIEFAAAGKHRSTFMEKMEKVVAAHPDQAFGVIHMGQLNELEVRRLAKAHSNLFFIMSHANPVSSQNTKQPWTNMFEGEVLKPVWKQLIQDYPDQFVIAFDNVFPEHWGTPYLKAVQYWRSAMAALPEPVARAIAHKNAERLWHLTPIH